MVFAGLATAAGSLAAIIFALLGAGNRAMDWVPRTWARILMAGIACPLRVTGLARLTPGAPYVFAANHSSMLDIPVLHAVLPRNMRFLAKEELFHVFLFGRAISRAGYVPIERGVPRQALASLAKAAERIAAGTSVAVFPEGTRGEEGRMLPFKAGALLLAIRAGCPVVPVYLAGTAQALPPKTLAFSPQRITVLVGEPIPTQGLKSSDREALARQVEARVHELAAQARGAGGAGGQG